MNKHQSDIDWMYEQVKWMKQETNELRMLFRQIENKKPEIRNQPTPPNISEAARGSILRIIDSIKFEQTLNYPDISTILEIANRELKKWEG